MKIICHSYNEKMSFLLIAYKREREARREYRKKREKATQINELFILDIMREGMKNEDLRLRCGLS